MEIKLSQLSLKNFKGIKDYSIRFDGKNAVVKGDNATGKTTLYDSFLWLLFDKDSNNSAKFSVKPQDESGNEIHFLETEVEAELSVDGKPLLLKKVLTENWVKPRGQEKQEYKGNTTTYFFDEVPVGANEYKSKVGNIVDEDTFKLITNPLYFCTQYKAGKLTDWQSRRIKLFEMCGDLTDEEVISVSPKLKPLPEILNGKSVDDRKAIIKASIKKLNDQIETVGPKINENMRLIPETPIDYTETENRIKELKTQLDGLDKQLATASEYASTIQKKHQELYVLKGKLDGIKTKLDNEANAERNALVVEKQKHANDKFALEGDIRRAKDEIQGKKNRLTNLTDQRNNLLVEYKKLTAKKTEIQASEFVEPDDDFTCPTCKQTLPEGDKAQKINELRKNFEEEKKTSLQNIDVALKYNIDTGKSGKQEISDIQLFIERNEPVIADSETEVQAINSRIKEIDDILLKPVATVDYSADADYAKTSEQTTALETELNKPVEDTTAETRQKKQEIQAQIDQCNYLLNNKEVAEKARERIEELKNEEKELSSQRSMLEGQLFLMDEFVKSKAELLSDAINGKFKHVRFKLFDIQINGNINECCEVLVNTNGCWVPFADGNTAGKMNAGLDIIQSMINFSGVSAPVFIDNSEAVTDIMPVDAQVIKLVKPGIATESDRKKYSKLNVEVG